MKLWRWVVLVVAGGTWAANLFGADKLDSLNGHGWSPNNHWFAFNPFNQDNLLVASVDGHRNFLLKPVGQVVIDTSAVFATGSGTNSTTSDRNNSDGITMIIGSPGRSKLEAQEWSPDGNTLAYFYDRRTRATMNVFEQTVTATYGLTNRLPWLKDDDVRVVFEYQRTTTNRPAQYALRAVRPDGSLVKEHVFRDLKEITRLSLLRNTDSSFITPDHRRLIYPRFNGQGWQLVMEDAAGEAGPRPLTEPAPGAPYEWKVSPDGKRVAVVEGPTSLAVGPLDNWSQAERVTFSNLTLNVAWSPDGRFLAANDKQHLYLLAFAGDTQRLTGDLVQVSDDCNPQFWGWRGTRLLFGSSKLRPADLFCIDTAVGLQVEQLIHSKPWQSAPIVRTISPDGMLYVCVMMEIDGEGRMCREIWKISTARNAEWELLERKATATGM